MLVPAATTGAVAEESHPASSGEPREVGPHSWAAGAHLSGLVWVMGLPGPVGPLMVWLLKRGEGSFVEDQGKEALNFQLSLVLYFTIVALVSAGWMIGLRALGVGVEVSILAGVTFLTFGGFLLLLFSLVFIVLASYKANQGEAWRYPFTVRFLS